MMDELTHHQLMQLSATSRVATADASDSVRNPPLRRIAMRCCR
jgi:hypothetical protein